MAEIIPVASGKGGTGKTLFVTNLGIALALKRKKVICIDLDLGCANLHTCLGIKNSHTGIGNFIYREESSLKNLIIKTEWENLYFIPGDVLLPATANLEYNMKRKMIQNIHQLSADYILLDLGAGTNFNVIDFFLMSSSGILVTTPETTAILNGYSFLKTLLFRMLYRSFPNRSQERQSIYDFLSQRIEATGKSFLTLINILTELNSQSGQLAAIRLNKIYPRIVLNMGKSKQDVNIGSNFRKICKNNLGINLAFIGFIFHQNEIDKSVFRRRPYVLDNPQSQYARAIHNIAEKITADQPGLKLPLFDADEDLREIIENLN